MELEHSHSKALAALQPFVHLAQTTSAPSPRFAATLITNATSSPQTYVFAELLDTPAVQALASPACPRDLQAYLKLLQIFAWGTWRDYESEFCISVISVICLHLSSVSGISVLSSCHSVDSHSNAEPAPS